MLLYSGDVAIANGDTYLYKDNTTARLWYATALEDKNSRNIALRKLIELERKMGDYKTAREYASMLSEYKDTECNYYFGKLEQTECNLINALEYYSKALATSINPLIVLCLIANVYVQLGEFTIARHMFETMAYSSSNYYKDLGFLELINLDILEGDYNHGLKLCEQVDYINNKQYKDSLKTIYILLMHHLGRIDELNKKIFGSVYTYNRLIAQSEETLNCHVKKHIKASNLNEVSFYSMDIINKIINTMDIIESRVNPIYKKGGLIYKYSTDYKIGEYRKTPLDTIAIVTTQDNIIMTMYPILISSEFDREGILYSEELKTKRLLGGK